MTFKTKTVFAVIMVLTLAVGIFTGSLMIDRANGAKVAEAASTPSNSSERFISVQGEGIIQVVPDIAYITLGVETIDKEMSVAQQTNKTRMNEIMAELTRLGIKKEDIQTQNYHVYPDYQWLNDKSVLVGYRVSNQVKVKIVKIDETGKVLDAVAGKGANMVYGIQFTVSDGNKAYHQALQLALKNAEDKAKLMVGYFNIKDIKPGNIVEGSQGYYPPIAYDKSRMELMDGGTPISAGEMEIRAQVSVSFSY